MGLISKLLLIVSIVLIGHSGFSSYEFHQIVKFSKNGASESSIRIPKDILYETIAGLVIFVLSSFLSFEKLSYLPLLGPKKLLTQGQYLLDIEMSKATNVDNLIGSDPAGAVNFTPNFVDIIAKRSQVKEWEAKKDI
ncbi:hypothetical protein HG536_0C04480 [Torulaspora globosa]|uniref:ER membrane protein complex subunit 5 n=1 Tax=Torulaspora globosa TaxID=48254 RepID=A0A7G3ZFJ3_9SACH|nr:uncharacterized protein HG536_0C04480 [Torulaspora globosa]QLL32279.1 hypothetical protein HG536_0C04480 [Torulaspora globosa]